MLAPVLQVVLALSACVAGANAAVLQSAFSDPYRPVPAVADTQSQVVYYRAGTPGQKAVPAFVYIDKEFHAGLLPGGYTVFCLVPGRHGLSAVLDDAPRYGGKRVQPGARLVAGRTYFMRVSDVGAMEPQWVDRETAERELAGALRQVHTVSRAVATRSCEYAQQQPEARRYSIHSDVLFGFGKSAFVDIRGNGRRELAELLRKLTDELGSVDLIEVVGHTDPIGSVPYNDALGMQRAQAVRQWLIEGGMAPSRISARSAGSREPVASGCSGSRIALVACHAADRRVVIEVVRPGEQ